MSKIINKIIELFFPKVNNIYDFLKWIFFIALVGVLTRFIFPSKYNELLKSSHNSKYNLFIKLVDFSLTAILTIGIFTASILVIACIVISINWILLKVWKFHSDSYKTLELPAGSKLTSYPLYVLIGCKNMMDKFAIWAIVLFIVLYFLSEAKGSVYINYVSNLISQTHNGNNNILTVPKLIFLIFTLNPFYRLLKSIILEMSNFD